jgi:sulfate permease, SulP family
VLKLRPALLNSFKGYNRKKFRNDIQSGLIISIIALPLSIALSVASGLEPAQGIYTAIFLGFVLALLSGSPVQIGGPTGTFLVLTLLVMSKYGFTGLFVVTCIAGIILIIMGFLGIGKVIKFIPYPVVSGFKVGIAIVILSTQIKDFLGLDSSIKIPSDFISKWKVYVLNINQINIQSVIIGILTILIILTWKIINNKIPGSFVAIIITSLIVIMFNFNVQTLGNTYHVQKGFNEPFYLINFNEIVINREILSFGFSLAILCAMEALLSAVVADGMLGTKHDSNMELVAEGVANITSVIFGGLPGVGAIARTATNVKNGGTTPIAGIIHSFILVGIVLFLTPLLNYIPMATLAGILFIVCYNMSDFKSFIELFKAPKSDIAILLTTLLLTVLIDLAFAVEVSMILASLLFLKRMSEVTKFDHIIDNESALDGDLINESLPEYSNEILIYSINGPFFFGAADRFMEAMNRINAKYKVLVIRMRYVPFIDATAMHALNNIYKKCHEHNIQIILSGVNEQPLDLMEKSGFIRRISREHVKNDIYDAVNLANKLIDSYNKKDYQK